MGMFVGENHGDDGFQNNNWNDSVISLNKENLHGHKGKIINLNKEDLHKNDGKIINLNKKD